MIDRPHVRKFRMKRFKNIKYSKKCAKQANYMKQVSCHVSKLNLNTNNCDVKILMNKKSNKTVDPQLNVLSNLTYKNDRKGRLRKVNSLAKFKLKNPLSAVPKNNLKSEENSSVYANSIMYVTRSSSTGKLSQMHQDDSFKAHMNKYPDKNMLKPQKCDNKIVGNLKIYKSQVPLDVLTICALKNGPKNKLRKASIILSKCDIKKSLSTSLQDPHNFVKSLSTSGNSVKYATRSSNGKLSEIHQNISSQTEKIKKPAGIKLNKKFKKTVDPLNVLSNCTDRNDRKGRLRKINTLAKSKLKISLSDALENNFQSEENSSVHANSITYVTRSSTGKLSQMHQDDSSKALTKKYSDIHMLKPKKCDKIVDNVKKYKSQVPLDVLSIIALNNDAKNKLRKANVVLSKGDVKNSLNTSLQDSHNFVKSSSTSGNSVKYATRSSIGKLSEIHQNILSQREKIKKPEGKKLFKKEAIKRSNISVSTANTEKSNYLKPIKPKILVKKFRNRSTKVSEKRCLNSNLNVSHSPHNRKGSSTRFFNTPLKCIGHNDKIEDNRISLQSKKHNSHFHNHKKETIDPVHESKLLLVNNKHPILKKSINCSSKQNGFDAEKLLNKTEVDNKNNISFINQSERRITRSGFNSTLMSEISLQKKTKKTNSLKALKNSTSPEIEYINQHKARTNKYQTRLSLQMNPYSLTENQLNSFNHSLPKSIIRKSTRSKSMKESVTILKNQKKSRKTLKRKLKNTRQKFLEQTVLPAEHDSCKSIAQNSGATEYFLDSSNTPFIHSKSKPLHLSSSIVNIKSSNMLQSTPFCQSSQNIKYGLGKKRIFKLSNKQNLIPQSTPIAKKNKNVVDLQTPNNSTKKLATKNQIVERKSTYRESKKAKNLLVEYCEMKAPLIKTPAKGVPQYCKIKAEPKQRSRKRLKQKNLGMQNRKSSNIFNGEPPKKSIPIDELTLLANSTKKRRKQDSCPARIEASKSSNVKSKSLKRKRSIIKALNEVNEGYEDDIFESHQFDGFKSAFQNFDDDSDVSSISTPKCFFITPALPEKTPLFKDCITADELCKARKVAEEYLYRRNKKRKTDSKELDETKLNPVTPKTYDALHLPEKKRLEFFEAMNTIANIQKTMDKQSQADSEDEQNSDDDTSDIFGVKNVLT